MIGLHFNLLIVIEYAGKTAKHEKLWKCRCQCGNTTVTRQGRLIHGKTKSCGCANKGNLRHGDRRCGNTTSEYHAWYSMLARCNNPKHKAYADYGGRGIRVCRRWFVFTNFLKDMGRKPSAALSLDRQNVNGNYSPRNCQWATKSWQNKNQRRWL